MTSFTALIDGKTDAYGVYFPDLPGCTAMGATLEETVVTRPRRCETGSTLLSRGAARFPSRARSKRWSPTPRVSADTAGGALVRSVPLVRHSGWPAKANLSIDAGILAAIDAEAKRRKLTRSAFIELMARHALPGIAL